MSEHICTACFRPMTAHPEEALDGERYWPPLCCEGCDCRSGAAAPAEEGTDA